MKKVISLAHSKGGVSKSTMAWNLAIALRMLGFRVALTDLDIQQLTISKTAMARTASGYEPFEVLTASSIDELSAITQSDDYDIVLIDVGGYDYDLGRVAISLSDRIVVPISEESTEILGFTSFLGSLKTISEHTPLPPIMIAITRAHTRGKAFNGVKSVAALWPSATIAETITRRRAVYSASMGHGFGVTELAVRHPEAADETYRLAREVVA